VAMREVVIVPTFQRREMLFVCLEAIRAAEPDIRIEVFPDRGTDETEVCGRFKAVHHKTIAHTYHGNSFVMLEALKFAYQQMYENVFVVEDDAIVDPSFFGWCRSALSKRPESFAACGWTYSPDALQPSHGPDIVIPWYLSVAAMLPRKSLYGIAQHARPEYYSDMKGYLDRAYAASHRRGSMHYEQDGLVLRVCESESKMCVWPRRPRAIHIGWRGYHVPDGAEIPGTLDEKVAVVKLILKSPAALKSLLNGAPPPKMEQCRICRKSLLGKDPDVDMICVDCFHGEYPHLAVSAAEYYCFPKSFQGEIGVSSCPKS
jgi:hypothetical protein